MGKGQDNATMMGKATTGFSALTMCIALIGLIIGAAMIQFHPPTEDYEKCDKSLTGENGWEGCEAVKDADPNYCSWTTDDDSSSDSYPSGSGSSSGSSTRYIKVMSDSCEDNGYYTIQTQSACESAAQDLSGYGSFLMSETDSGYPKGCYDAGSVYFNQATSGTVCRSGAVCLCARSSFYASSSGGRRRLLADDDHFGIQEWAKKTLLAPPKRRLTDGSPTTCQSIWTGTTNYGTEMCCGAEASVWDQLNQVLDYVRLISCLGALAVIVGMVPILIGGIGKAMGNDNIGNISGGVGVGTSCCCTVIVGLAGTVIPLYVGAYLQIACDSYEDVLDTYITDCDDNDACSAALDAQVQACKNVAIGAQTASVVCIIAVLFGIITSILTCVGFCQQKAPPAAQQPQVVVMNPVPVAAGQPGQPVVVVQAQMAQPVPGGAVIVSK